jgi:hypothetical protein
MMKYIKLIVITFCLLIFAITFTSEFSRASGIGEEEVDLPEPQGSCSSDPCSPAKPCPSPDESCYSSNGVFYCCVEPPFPGAEAVGN